MTTKKSSLSTLLESRTLLVIFSILFAVTTLAQMLVVNRTLNPHSPAFSPLTQLQLQFAYTPQNGMKVLSSWGPGSRERYLSVIWIDLLFAASYGPAFCLYIRRLGGSLAWSVIPLFEMLSNWIETSLEIYWVGHHSAENLMFGIFMTHSVVATVKWCVLVPTYALDLGWLIIRWMGSKSAKAEVSRAQVDPELGA